MEESRTSLISSVKQNELITTAFNKYHSSLVNYISNKTNCREDAEDIAQDVFIRLIDYKQMILEETVKSFVYTIARNLTIDYLRRHCKMETVSIDMFEHHEISPVQIECNLDEKRLLRLENIKLRTFSPQRKIVYSLSRKEELSVNEISESLQISRRTVECHLLAGRKMMREYIKQCI